MKSKIVICYSANPKRDMKKWTAEIYKIVYSELNPINDGKISASDLRDELNTKHNRLLSSGFPYEPVENVNGKNVRDEKLYKRLFKVWEKALSEIKGGLDPWYHGK